MKIQIQVCLIRYLFSDSTLLLKDCLVALSIALNFHEFKVLLIKKACASKPAKFLPYQVVE